MGSVERDFRLFSGADSYPPPLLLHLPEDDRPASSQRGPPCSCILRAPHWRDDCSGNRQRRHAQKYTGHRAEHVRGRDLGAGCRFRSRPHSGREQTSGEPGAASAISLRGSCRARSRPHLCRRRTAGVGRAICLLAHGWPSCERARGDQRKRIVVPVVCVSGSRFAVACLGPCALRRSSCDPES